jgi:uracil-DNA glycosylase
VVKVLSDQKSNLVFMLWGAYAQKKGAIINDQRHLVLQAPHPSPLSAYQGFFGCNHFSQCNLYLELNGLDPIDW